MSDRAPQVTARRGRPHILVIRRRYLGDTVLTQPLLRNLRAHWPEAWITLVVDTPYKDALATCPDVDEILEIPVGRLGLRAHLARWAKTLRAVVRHAPYDLAFDLARNERAQLLLLASQARRRATIVVEGRVHRRRFYTDVLQVTHDEVGAAHTVDLNNRLLAMVGVPTPFRVPTVPVRDDDRAAADALLAEVAPPGRNGVPLLMVHPGSGSEARRWPPENFARVADRAVDAFDARVVVLYGAREAHLASAIVDEMERPAVLLPAAPSVPVLFALLARADLFLCNDSGPMHMAAAVGTPVCALFGSQSVTTWAPLGPADHLTFQTDLPCGERCVAVAACNPNDPMHSFCVRRVEPETVAAELTTHWARSPSAGPSGAHS